MHLWRSSACWCCVLVALFLSACLATFNTPQSINTVHLIFACHLDVGYTEEDIPVINKHFHEHYPKAIRVSQELRARGGPEGLVFLTHSWLVSLFLDCPGRIGGLVCPNATEVQAFKAAAWRGDIVWHAFPFNAQAEVFDADLLAGAVEITHEIDRQLGLPPKRTMSQRDVPGMTRAAVPILHSRGVRALSVGVNGISAPPGVPKNAPFWWRDEPSGAALLAFWHAGGYSGNVKRGDTVDPREECVHAKGFSHVLCGAWRGDNDGPPSAEEVVAVFEQKRQEFPGAEIIASTLDAFVEPLLEAAPGLDLPVVTDEIGDTWIYGVPSDAGKISEYRALLRVAAGATAEERSSIEFKRFSRLLMKIPEHTWGLAFGTFLGDWESWANKDFHAQLANKTARYLRMVGAWQSQRQYLRWAVEELVDTSLGTKARQALQHLEALKAPPDPAKGGFERVDLAQPLTFSCPAWELELSPVTGAVVGLQFRQPEPQAQPGPGAAASAPRTQAQGRSGGGRTLSMAASDALQHSLGAAGQEGLTAGRHSGQEPLGEGAAGDAGTNFASPDFPLALVVYSTYSEDDYRAYGEEYAYIPDSDWFLVDLGKRNSTVKSGVLRADAVPRLQGVWYKQTSGGGLHLVTKATFPDYFVQEAGAPRAVWTEIRASPGSSHLEIDILWEDKTPTRLAETLWVRWRPNPSSVEPSSWLMTKLGQQISPLEVLRNGSHGQHVVGEEGVSVRSSDGSAWLRIRSLDAALVSPGAPAPFPALSTQPDLRQGMTFSLTNNLWGTNYVLWTPYQASDANMRFRFVVGLEGGTGEGHGGDQAAAQHK